MSLMAAEPLKMASTMLLLVREASVFLRTVLPLLRPLPLAQDFRRYASISGVQTSSHSRFRQRFACLMLNCSEALPASMEKVKPLSTARVRVCLVSPSSVTLPYLVVPLRL